MSGPTARRAPASRAARPAGPKEPPRPRVRLEVDARRAQLLALGMEAFTTQPYDAVSLDELARRAGVSKGLLFHYFPSKRAFYAAVLEVGAAELLARTVPPRDAPPLERLRLGLDAYLSYVEQHALAYTALLRSGVGSDPALARLVDRTREALVERVREGMPFPSDAPTLRLALRGWVGAVEAASLDWAERRDLPRATLVALLVRLLLASIHSAVAVLPR